MSSLTPFKMDAHTLRPREFADAQSHHSIGVTVFLHIRDVRFLDAYRLELGFSDCRLGIADLEAELVGPVFSQLLDPDLFRRVVVNAELGMIQWANGADFAPEFHIFWHFGTIPPSSRSSRLGAMPPGEMARAFWDGHPPSVSFTLVTGRLPLWTGNLPVFCQADFPEFAT